MFMILAPNPKMLQRQRDQAKAKAEASPKPEASPTAGAPPTLPAAPAQAAGAAPNPQGQAPAVDAAPPTR